ncbi:unnamed protein product [Nezara viridula]|uniref:Neuropeptide n=1 Tax=Nezara viridula TaxID=85310 RepID=A0A9P0E253_NEZVI|nr:unnamed protein product [Nezara viridula]
MFISLLLIALCGCNSVHALSLDPTGHDGLAGDINISPDVRSEKQSLAESVLDIGPNTQGGKHCTATTCCPFYMFCCNNNMSCCKIYRKTIPASASYC